MSEMSSSPLSDFDLSAAFSYADHCSTDCFATNDGSGSFLEAVDPLDSRLMKSSTDRDPCFDLLSHEEFLVSSWIQKPAQEPAAGESPSQEPAAGEPSSQEPAAQEPREFVGSPKYVAKPGKRARAQNWTLKEKKAYLELMKEARQVVRTGPIWDWISAQLLIRKKIKRTAKGCEHHWTTLMRSYKSDATRGGEHSDMDAAASSLPLELFVMMETIVAAKKNSKPTLSTKLPAAPDPPFETLIKQHVECGVSSEVEKLCSSPAFTSAARDKILKPRVPRLKQQVEAGVNRKLDCFNSAGHLHFDGDNPAPCITIKEVIKDAVSSALQPMADVLQTLAREQQEDTAALVRALRKQKQALRWIEKRRKSKRPCRMGGHQQTLIDPAPEVRRGTNQSTAGEITSPLQEMRIVEEDIMLEGER